MKYIITYIIFGLLLAALINPAAYADDNIANCEIVVQRPIEMVGVKAPEVNEKEGENKSPDAEELETEELDTEEKTHKADNAGAQIATFLPAADFIFSVFDAKEGHITEIDNQPIRAIMCIRISVIPTEFDLKIIRTGLPFYLSPDFDAKGSALMAINSTKQGYVYDYVGPDLTEDETELLKLRMALFNQQEDKHED
ncbi:MAG: hypothetical protein COA91_02640 [Robiginitomaculum sp.]|nr:MAG: hypothetical protein COA91_02640 [Robiginitomaculum sp.]